MYTTQDASGEAHSVTVPMRYVYMLASVAVVGAFTVMGMAGSYTRMLVKTESTNRLRSELAMSRQDYAHLEKRSHERDVQAASLSSLASEVSAIYGLTAGKLTLPHRGKAVVANASQASLKDDSNLSDESYMKSVDTFYALRDTASSGRATGLLSNPMTPALGIRSKFEGLGSFDVAAGVNVPDMWPILGPITSGFGEREDPVIGMGTGEFHKGVDIGSPDGTPVHAPADGRVLKAGMGSGYGREIVIDHGNGIKTVYGHLQGFNVSEGETVVKGQVIGFVGHSGRTTGSHLHYEVQIHDTAVNPHKYLRTTMAQIGGLGNSGF